MIGVILAGGESRRMGENKAEIDLAGRPMSGWVERALASVCEAVVVSGRDSLPDPEGVRRGPLGGLVAALRRYPDKVIALVAVDQPWVQPETIRRLGESVGDLSAVPVEGGVRQTTCAVYASNVSELAESELAGGGSLQSLLDLTSFTPVVDWHDWGEDGRSWFSVDSPSDLAEGLERYGPPDR